MTFPLGLHQTCFFEDSHVMRNRGLRKLYTLLNIPGTEPSFLVDRASTFFFKCV